MAKKRQYLFYTTEGFTQAPDGVEIDNCQILAFIDAEEERQAWQKFKVENAWMEGRGFSLQGVVCRELLVSEGNRNKDSGMPRFLIRPASFTDLPQIMEIYAAARDFMRRSGNPGQWIDGYPQETVVRRDLENGDLFVQKAPAATLEVLAQALKETYAQIDPKYGETEVKIIGTRHGEKLYETLVTREEMAKAIDMGGYYRIPCDNRDLNYDKYFIEGSEEVSHIEDYHSHNTARLDVEGMKKLLLKLNFIREDLGLQEKEKSREIRSE